MIVNGKWEVALRGEMVYEGDKENGFGKRVNIKYKPFLDNKGNKLKCNICSKNAMYRKIENPKEMYCTACSDKESIEGMDWSERGMLKELMYDEIEAEYGTSESCRFYFK